jgi:hypothetical protein
VKQNNVVVIQEESVREFLDSPVQKSMPNFLAPMASAAINSSALDLAKVMPYEIVQQHQHLMQIADRHHFNLRPLGATLTFEEPRIYQGTGSDWALMPLEQDSFYRENQERMVLPKEVYTNLQGMNNEGIDFDALYVAHELPSGLVRSGQPIPSTYLAPPPPPQKAARLKMLSQASTLYQRALRTAVLTAGIGTALVATMAIALPILVVGAALTLPAAAVGLDPVLFGVNIDYSRTIGGQHPCLIYVLAQWSWPQSDSE